MNLSPLGDQGVLATFTSEDDALAFTAALRSLQWSDIVDIVPAYSTVAVFHNPHRTRIVDVMQRLHAITLNSSSTSLVGRLHRIPCCYELGPDLERVATHLGRKPADVVELHSHADFTVYAIGFCPGFPYLGYLPAELCGVPRLPAPRLRVEPGSVGLTGRQTGIYPLERPGGWNLIGRTPLQIVDVEDGYFPIRAGDRVRFRPIGRDEFEALCGKRL